MRPLPRRNWLTSVLGIDRAMVEGSSMRHIKAFSRIAIR